MGCGIWGVERSKGSGASLCLLVSLVSLVSFGLILSLDLEVLDTGGAGGYGGSKRLVS